MKPNFIILILLFVSTCLIAQENERPPEKGLVIDNPALNLGSPYRTISPLYEMTAEPGTFRSTNWKKEPASGDVVFSTGEYSGNANYFLESESIALPILRRTNQRINLYLTEWFELESHYDQGVVQVSADNGKTWDIISVRSGRGDKRTSIINVSSYAGKTVKFSFELNADATNNYAGWTISKVSLKHEQLASESKVALDRKSKTDKISARTAGTLSGTLTNLDAQRFPRFIFGNVNVLDGGLPLDSLDESNFFVKEFIQNPVDTTRIDTLVVAKDEFFKVFAPNSSDSTRLPVDIVFLMDNSGSMGDEQAQVATNVTSFAQALDSANYDFRLGLCRFGQGENSGNPIFHDNAAFYSDDTTFVNVWNTVNTTNGSREPSWDAMFFSASTYSFRPGAQKIFILITDEQITGNNDRFNTVNDQQLIIDRLVDNGIRTYALVPSSPVFNTDFGTIATATGGRQYNILSPFNDILQDIGSQIENTYTVRYAPTNPVFDGRTRQVEITVQHQGNELQLYGSYRPGAAPSVLRTDATIALSDDAQLQLNAIDIAVRTFDWLQPYTNDVTLFYRKVDDTTATYTELPMIQSNVTQQPNGLEEAVWTATIPPADVVGPGISYYVRASDGAITTTAPEFIDREGFPWSFAVLPNLPPSVSHTPIKSADPKDSIQFVATVTDNTNFVDNVFLNFKTTGDINFTQVAMSPVAGTDDFTYTLSALNQSTIVEYFIVGIDNFGVSTFSGTELAPYAISVGGTIPPPSSPFTHNIRFTGFPPFQSTVTIGSSPIVSGDQIVVYYTDDFGALQVGGVVTWNGGGFHNLVAFGDNPTTPAKDGFANGEAFTFSIIRASDGEEFSASHQFYVPPSRLTFTSFQFSFVQTLQGLLKHSYDL